MASEFSRPRGELAAIFFENEQTIAALHLRRQAKLDAQVKITEQAAKEGLGAAAANAQRNLPTSGAKKRTEDPPAAVGLRVATPEEELLKIALAKKDALAKAALKQAGAAIKQPQLAAVADPKPAEAKPAEDGPDAHVPPPRVGQAVHHPVFWTAPCSLTGPFSLSL